MGVVKIADFYAMFLGSNMTEAKVSMKMSSIYLGLQCILGINNLQLIANCTVLKPMHVQRTLLKLLSHLLQVNLNSFVCKEKHTLYPIETIIFQLSKVRLLRYIIIL